MQVIVTNNSYLEEQTLENSFFNKLLSAVYDVYVCESEEMKNGEFEVEIMDYETFAQSAVNAQNHIAFCICDGNTECEGIEYYADADTLQLVAHTQNGNPYRAVQFDSKDEMLKIIRGLYPNELYNLVDSDEDASDDGLWEGKPIIKYKPTY